MAPRGWRSISVREGVYERLRRFAEERGLTSISDAIALLLDAVELCRALGDRLGELEAEVRKTYLAVLRLIEEARHGGEG